jgi:hypothetical protein
MRAILLAFTALLASIQPSSADPTGEWLVAANQDSQTLSLFCIDPVSGLLAYHDTHALTVTRYYIGAFVL